MSAKVVWRRSRQRDGDGRSARLLIDPRSRRQPHRGARPDTPGRPPAMLRASAEPQCGAVTGRDGCRRIVPQQLDQGRERCSVVGRRRHERELDSREVVAEGEQVELSYPVRRAVGGVWPRSAVVLTANGPTWCATPSASTRSTRGSLDRQAVLRRRAVRSTRVTLRRPRSPQSVHPSWRPASGKAAIPQT